MDQIILRTNGTAEGNCGTTVWCRSSLEPTEIDAIGSSSLLHRAFSHLYIMIVYVIFSHFADAKIKVQKSHLT